METQSIVELSGDEYFQVPITEEDTLPMVQLSKDEEDALKEKFTQEVDEQWKAAMDWELRVLHSVNVTQL
ncbi:hypothetical protein, partial [Enterobacter cloacae complex sp. CH23B]|uniref:hypothetical protein n=1 Tax=Enterobacter cloacae complex sp. CH23B TaxID=2511986 RepID=UPI00102658CC